MTGGGGRGLDGAAVEAVPLDPDRESVDGVDPDEAALTEPAAVVDVEGTADVTVDDGAVDGTFDAET